MIWENNKIIIKKKEKKLRSFHSSPLLKDMSIIEKKIEPIAGENADRRPQTEEIFDRINHKPYRARE